MKKFAIYSRVDLIKRPEWFDIFEKEYLDGGWHVTLKQACYIEDTLIDDVKLLFSGLDKDLKINNKKIILVFDDLFIDKERESKKNTIMIRTKNNKEIDELQKTILSKFKLEKYNNYCLEESRDWEKNFKPHLTIASCEDGLDYERAKALIGEDVYCEGVINNIILVFEDENGERVRIELKFL